MQMEKHEKSYLKLNYLKIKHNFATYKHFNFSFNNLNHMLATDPVELPLLFVLSDSGKKPTCFSFWACYSFEFDSILSVASFVPALVALRDLPLDLLETGEIKLVLGLEVSISWEPKC